jgi:hypothetical protein
MQTSMSRRGNVDGRNDKEWDNQSWIREDERSKEYRYGDCGKLYYAFLHTKITRQR